VKRLLKLSNIHERAPLDRHLELLFRDMRAGRAPLLEVTAKAIQRTGTNVPPLKSLHRRYATMNLVAYFMHARSSGARWAECGVYNGCSSLSLCLAARSVEPAFDGSGMHLVDSFEGLGAAAEEDHHAVTDEHGRTVAVPPIIQGSQFRTSVDRVRAAFSDFPGVQFHQGWIPSVLATLPEGDWSFVHIDVDLYEPTRACLEYFIPRLAPGGVIVCDDYGAPTFPGAERAWDEVCAREGVPFVALPTGQAVILKT
jgi:predicted O-methyltransferase YrrM